MIKKNTEYYIGLVATCLAAILLSPLFMLVCGVIRLGVLIIDTLMLSYNAMIEYDKKFQQKYQNKDLLKRN